jgi:23S rRNA (cytidine1920-2'-O)/16S rRNA (cytidine1409-2'-O)-methyltransferase
VLQRILACADGLGLAQKATLDSPIRGKKGNLEFLSIFEFRRDFCAKKEPAVTSEV